MSTGRRARPRTPPRYGPLAAAWLDRARRLARLDAAAAPTGAWFREIALPPAGTRNVYDLGVVDLGRDGNLGIFTTNHNSRQAVLANEGGGRFRDVLDELGLNQDVAFPTWEDDLAEPAFAGPGLYLYRRRNTVVIRSVAGADALGAELVFPSSVVAAGDPPAGVEVSTVTAADGRCRSTRVRFAAAGDTTFEVTPDLVGIPLDVRLDGGVPLSSMFVGSGSTNPVRQAFRLVLRDRHGMAWADHDGSGRLGVFIVRGGLKGRLDEFPGQVGDELLSGTASGLAPAPAAGIAKGCCRGRQAAWVALDGGAPPALFVSCQQGAVQLYRRGDDGAYLPCAGDLGLADVRGDVYAWVDVDGDGRPELLAARGDELSVYARRDDGRFARSQVVALRCRGGWVGALAVGDYAGGGRPDLFAPSTAGNTLLVNEGGRYRPLDPRTVGLPGSGGRTAAWVDYDNDGRLDLHVLPGGLFRQVAGGRFVATRLLDDEIPAEPEDVRLTWFDADNDGARDLVVAFTTERRVKGGAFEWAIRAFRNVGATGHWLEVDLAGPPANPQALGAAVAVAAGGRRSVQWVGGNEGSHYSQGHYRLYFGLGQAATASVEVRWPDGSVQDLGPRAADELVTVAHPDARGAHPRDRS